MVSLQPLSALRPWEESPVDCVWNVMAHAQKPDFVFRRNGRVYLNRRGRQFSRILAAEVYASAVAMVVMLDKPSSEVVWRVLAIHSIRQFPLHFPSRALSCAITFQLDSTYWNGGWMGSTTFWTVSKRENTFNTATIPSPVTQPGHYTECSIQA